MKLLTLHTIRAVLVAAIVVSLACTTFISCADKEDTLDDRIALLDLSTLPDVPHPSTNPYAEDKVKLGKILFYDPILSGERDIACVTCHHPSLGYGDALDLSIGSTGHGLGELRVRSSTRIPYAIRNSSTVVNVGYNGLGNAAQTIDELLPPMTWAVVRRPLEAQTFGALGNRSHMKGDAYSTEISGDSVTARLAKIAEYVQLFDKAFGGGSKSVTRANIGKAIGTFQRSLVSRNSPYDKYVNGDHSALNDSQKRGLLLFFGKANCITCHTDPMFSDYQVYNLGIADNPKNPDPDLGFNKQRLFRTPTLRNAALTAPYMHNGMIATLKQVVEYYNRAEPANPNVAPGEMSIKLKPLHLSDDEVNDIVAFIGALTDDSYDKTVLTQVPSGLKAGGN